MKIAEPTELLRPMLREVSRSFYLTLRILPAEIRPQISLAYLLARASDTIADTEAAPKSKRVEALREFAENIKAPTDRRTPNYGVRQLAAAVPSMTGGEARLLEHVDDCLSALATFSEEDRALIAGLLDKIITGQIFDLEHFPGKSLTDDELDRYTYLVAGCVGEFWTRMCAAHLPELEGWKDGKLEEAGVRFGKGLQLVNILRDIPRDVRMGRCYLPASELAALLDVGNFDTIQSLYDRWLNVAVAHLDAGWQYTLNIPAEMTRLRLACIWPIWIGLKTIARLRRANPLDATQRVRVSRAEVYWIMLESYLLCRNDATLDEKYQRLREPAAATCAARP